MSKRPETLRAVMATGGGSVIKPGPSKEKQEKSVLWKELRELGELF